MAIDPYSGIVEMAGRVRSGNVTATELATVYLDRSEAAQDTLNAFTEIDREASLARAGSIDAAVSSGDDPGPLAGVPIALKDLIDHAGHTTTCGSSFYRHRPDRSATVVERLERAGAVITGRTGLHEFAYGFSSENHWFGPVRNPWDPETSPGGSSGGSAVAAAAGLAAAAIGTDTGGSVRVPAALCGIVGLKVTHGRVPLTGVFPLASSLDTVGPLTRSTADAAVLYEVMAGDDPGDPWSAPREVERAGGAADLAGLRIAVPHPWVDQPLAAAVRDGYRAGLDSLADAGADITEVEHPLLDPEGLIADYFAPEVAAVHRSWFERHPERYGPEVAARIAAVFEVDADRHVSARRWRRSISHLFDRLLLDADVIATPATGALRKRIGVDTIEIEGTARPYRPVLSAFSSLVNQAGNPAIVLPLAVAGEPPPSLQLIGQKWGEHRLLEIGAALEQRQICRFRPPPGP